MQPATCNFTIYLYKMNTNEQLIQRFYTAFQQKDYQTMQDCYAENVTFDDPAFPGLVGKRAKAMWHMLVTAGTDLQLTFNDIKAGDTTGSCNWVAVYTFSLTGRKVTNRVQASFLFSNGKIIHHQDTFNFHKWASQAMGAKGLLLGWTGFFRKKVQTITRQRLDAFVAKHPEYK